jgi:hypothetical protein
MAARVVLGLVLAAVLAAPAHAAFGPNLLTNGDAEDGPGATDSTTKVPVPGWTTAGDFTVMQYGTYGFADSPDDGASNMFVGGPNASDSSATQVIDVSGNAEPIDDGAFTARLSALLGGFASQDDQGVVQAHFLGAGQTELGHFSIGPVTAGDRKGQTVLLRRARAVAMPSGTRRVVVTMIASKANGTYNDGYIDDVSLRLGSAPPRRANWKFGFRIARVDREASYGSHGSFTTQGQANVFGEVTIKSVSARPFTASWTYQGHRFYVSFRFLPRGNYIPAGKTLTMYARVTGTNVPGCRGVGEFSFGGDVETRFCGAQEMYYIPGQATFHVARG